MIPDIINTAFELNCKTVSIDITRVSNYYEVFKKLKFTENLNTKHTVAGMVFNAEELTERCWLPHPSTENFSPSFF